MGTLMIRRAAEFAGLTPDQASEMTPYDLQVVIEAGVARVERDRELTAWMTAHLMSVQAGQQITMDDLLGPRWSLRRMERERGIEE